MSKIPQTDSVTELARFWDAHDLSEFDDEIEEVKAPVFKRGRKNVLYVTLAPSEAKALHRAAESRGLADTELAHRWLSEKLRVS